MYVCTYVCMYVCMYMYVYIYPPAPLGATRLRSILGLSNKSYSLSCQSQQQVLQPFSSCSVCRSYLGVFLAFMQPCLEVIFLSSLPAIWNCCFLAPLDEEFYPPIGFFSEILEPL